MSAATASNGLLTSKVWIKGSRGLDGRNAKHSGQLETFFLIDLVKPGQKYKDLANAKVFVSPACYLCRFSNTSFLPASGITILPWYRIKLGTSSSAARASIHLERLSCIIRQLMDLLECLYCFVN